MSEEIKEESPEVAEEEPIKEESEEPAKEESEKAPAAKTTSIHIGNLPFSYTEEQLSEKYREFGEVISSNIPRKPNGNSKGYGFVEMKNKEDAEKAIEMTDNTELEGRKLHVELSTPRKEHSHRSYDDRRSRRRYDYDDDYHHERRYRRRHDDDYDDDYDRRRSSRRRHDYDDDRSYRRRYDYDYDDDRRDRRHGRY